MTPPAHLLPLALEAMTSADACEVLGDALLESGWCDWRIGYVRDYGRVPAKSWATDSDMAWARHVVRLLIEYPRACDANARARAIAAVLLFGEWETERWPLVEANEARLGWYERALRRHVEAVMSDGWTLRASDIAPGGQLLYIQQRDEEDDDADLG